MTTVLNIHTHNTADPEAVVSVMPADFRPRTGMLYSVGIHPWHSADADVAEQLSLLGEAAAHRQVVAIGETGLDLRHGASLDLQAKLMRTHIQLAEKLGKPVVLHMVRTSQQVLSLWRQSGRCVPWAIHGMRGNANVARPLIEAGFYLSYGYRFNPAAVLATPIDRLLIETDDAHSLSIHTVAAQVAQVLGLPTTDLERAVSTNASRFLGI